MSLVKNWRCGLSLTECNRYMLTHQINSDVTFSVGNEGKLVHAHKYVLASRSPVFDVMLYGDLAESDVIKVPDIEPSTFDALLRFMYCDEASYTEDTVIALLYAAHKYEVDDLVTNITSYLDQKITDETVITIFESAQFFNLDDLVKKCKDYIEEDLVRFLQSPPALEITRETLAFILSLDSFVIDELQIYQFLVRWAENQCDEAGMTKTDQNIRMMMGDFIYQIRFHLIDIDTFVKDVCNREILEDEDKLNLQQVIVGNADKKDTKFKSEERKRVFRLFRSKKHVKIARGLHTCIVDHMDFTVSKDVTLHGFVMWGASGPYEYEVEGELFKNYNVVTKVDPHINRDEEENTFTLNLPQPVLLSPGERYTIWMRLDGPKGWEGQDYKSSVTQHGVQFDFYTHTIGKVGTKHFQLLPAFVCSL